MILHLMKLHESCVEDVTSLSASTAPSVCLTVTYADNGLFRLWHVAYVVVRQHQQDVVIFTISPYTCFSEKI